MATSRFLSKQDQERANQNFIQNLSDDSKSDGDEYFSESEGVSY